MAITSENLLPCYHYIPKHYLNLCTSQSHCLEYTQTKHKKFFKKAFIGINGMLLNAERLESILELFVLVFITNDGISAGCGRL